MYMYLYVCMYIHTYIQLAWLVARKKSIKVVRLAKRHNQPHALLSSAHEAFVYTYASVAMHSMHAVKQHSWKKRRRRSRLKASDR